MKEENRTGITTQVAQRVSTKTKVLVGVVMGLAIVGMFAFVGMAFENVKNSDYYKKLNIQVQLKKKGYFVNQDMDSYASFDNLGQDMMDRSFNDREEKELGIKDIQGVLEKKGTLWQGVDNKIFKLNKEKKENLLGLEITEEELREAKERERNQIVSRDGELPNFFDWRDLHGGLDYTTPVRDQGNCGSCWSFAALGAFEANIEAYYNNPNLNIDLSEQDLVSCYLGDGCNGAYTGEIESLFNDYFQNTGVANETCFPYTETDIDCENKCSDWQNEAWKTVSFVSSEMTIDDIKTALIENGPLEVGMEVYADFPAYDNGIYHHVTGDLLGYHAVLIVGYGVYDGMDYWIVKNSWGEDWGDNGYFKILAGDSLIDSLFAYGIEQPEKLIEDSPERLCVDQDEDGYCYWGLGDVPSTCSSTCILDISDCNDANEGIFEDCGENTETTGFLNITSEPSDAEVYIKDLDSNNWIYRGNTPLEIELNVGEREVLVSKEDYIDDEEIVLINEDSTGNYFVELNLAPKLISPENRDILRAGGIIEIIGTVPGPDLESFSIEYGLGENPTEWFTEGIDLINNGQVPIVEDVLATWNTSFITEDNFYTLRLIINFTNEGETFYIENLYLDSTLKEGWPIKLDNRESDVYWGLFQPSVADLNNDGNKEIIVYEAGNDNKLYVYDYAGNILPNFPVNLPSDGLESIVVLPAIGDINNDGFKEIIILGGNIYTVDCGRAPLILIYDYYGNQLDSFPLAYPDLPYGCDTFSIDQPAISLADLNQDGNLEIIVLGGTAITILDNFGNTFNGWPKYLSGWVGGTHESSPAVGNLDDDDDLEIIVSKDWAPTQGNPVDNKGMIYVWNFNGTNVPGWPIETHGYSHSSATIGDIDNDGENEVVVGFNYDENPPNDYGIYIYDNNGNVLDGWPQLYNKEVWSNPVLGDFDNNNELEIIVSSFYHPYETYIFDNNGNVLDGWPQQMCYADWYSPIVSDITGDGILDVITNNNFDSDCSIYAWNYDGSLINNFPKITQSSVYSPVVISDIDNNNFLELIATSNSFNYEDGIVERVIYVWDLDASSNSNELSWSQFRHDNQNTGNYNFRRCSNEVAYSECSSEQPLFCSNGELIDDCQECGCPMDESCQEDGSCDLTKSKETEATPNTR
jgi:C1A family cysteine protease